MGEVYRARDPRLGRDVALKVLHGDVAQSSEGRARFEREARSVAALNHPNIVSMFDIGEKDGMVFFVSELVDGELLRARIARGPVASSNSSATTAQSLIQIVPASTSRATRSGRSTSRVQIEAERPYLLSFASRTASASVSKTCMVRTGPNTSSCTIVIFGSVISGM
jgi:serine/threonine protein kinase